MKPRWRKTVSGKRWRFETQAGNALGFVTASYPGGWDGYVCTGEKWPAGDKLVTALPPMGQTSGGFWEARRAVENALRCAEARR